MDPGFWCAHRGLSRSSGCTRRPPVRRWRSAFSPRARRWPASREAPAFRSISGGFLAPGPEVDADRRPEEPEALAQSVLEEAAVREVNELRVIHFADEGRWID